jgi:hypothetical protein
MSDIPEQIAKLSPEKLELLARRLRQMRGQVTGALPVQRRGNPQDPAPLSYDQRRLWFLYLMDPQSAAYNIPTAVRLDGPLDLPALEKSLSEVVRRHEILRTTFAEVDGQPVQVIRPHSPMRLEVTDLSLMRESERDAELLRLTTAEAREPFDLRGGPGFRAKLFRLAGEQHVLAYTLHHIISDARSCEILNAEMEALYKAFSQGRPSPLEELPIQYADFTTWQREWLRTAQLDEQMGYWKKRLEGSRLLLELRTDRPRPDGQSYRGMAHALALSKELSDAIKQFSAANSITLFTTLLAAFHIMLRHHSGQDDIVVGAPITNRNTRETERLIGLFVNTLAIRVDLSGDPTLIELLHRVRDVMVSAYAHRDLPLDMLVQAIQPERRLGHSPLFQVTFTLQTPQAGGDGFSSVRLSELPVHNGMAQFDLVVNISDTRQGIAGQLEYSTDLFDQSTIGRMVKHYELILRAVIDRPGSRLSSLQTTLDEEDRRRRLAEEVRLEQARLKHLTRGRRRSVAG